MSKHKSSHWSGMIGVELRPEDVVRKPVRSTVASTSAKAPASKARRMYRNLGRQASPGERSEKPQPANTMSHLRHAKGGFARKVWGTSFNHENML